MSTNEQRRAAAKRKLERQIELRAAQAKRRKQIAAVSVVGVVVAAGLLAGYFFWLKPHNEKIEAQKQAEIAANTCAYKESDSDKVPENKKTGLPPNPNPKPRTGTVNADLKTTAGDIPLTMDRAQAPCTVQSAVHLIEKKFYDGTKCHRETNYVDPKSGARLQVLQCGDPLGTGQGGPGYTIPDEKPQNLKPAPIKKELLQPGQPAPVIYPRGTLAMAKTQAPDSGGSQFFIVWGDTYLPPEYTAFGKISDAGMKVVDKITAAGITPAEGSPKPQKNQEDGSPKKPVTITTASVVSKS